MIKVDDHNILKVVVILTIGLALAEIIVKPVETIWCYNMTYMPLKKGIFRVPNQIIYNMYAVVLATTIYIIIVELASISWIRRWIVLILALTAFSFLYLYPSSLAIFMTLPIWIIIKIMNIIRFKITVYFKLALVVLNVLLYIFIFMKINSTANANKEARRLRGEDPLSSRSFIILLLLLALLLSSIALPEIFKLSVIPSVIAFLTTLSYPPKIPTFPQIKHEILLMISLIIVAILTNELRFILRIMTIILVACFYYLLCYKRDNL